MQPTLDFSNETAIQDVGIKLRLEREEEEDLSYRIYDLKDELAREKAIVEKMKLVVKQEPPSVDIDKFGFDFKTALLRERQETLEAILNAKERKKARLKEIQEALDHKRQEASTSDASEAAKWESTVAERLGFKITRRDDEQELDLAFWNIDPDDPRRTFSFTLGLDESGRFMVFDEADILFYVPEVRKILKRLNQRHAFALAEFASSMRDAFVTFVSNQKSYCVSSSTQSQIHNSKNRRSLSHVCEPAEARELKNFRTPIATPLRDDKWYAEYTPCRPDTPYSTDDAMRDPILCERCCMDPGEYAREDEEERIEPREYPSPNLIEKGSPRAKKKEDFRQSLLTIPSPQRRHRKAHSPLPDAKPGFAMPLAFKDDVSPIRNRYDNDSPKSYNDENLCVVLNTSVPGDVFRNMNEIRDSGDQLLFVSPMRKGVAHF